MAMSVSRLDFDWIGWSFDWLLKASLYCLQDLIQQIPDVSSAPEEDQYEINYCNYDKTQKICAKARKQISRLSLNVPPPPKSDDEEEQENVEPSEPAKTKPLKVVTKAKKVRSVRLSCPPIPVLHEETGIKSGIYPKLGDLNASSDWSEVSALGQPPPTYSDSESMSSQKPSQNFMASYRRVVPSAPPVFEEPQKVINDTLHKPASRVKIDPVPEVAPMY